MNRGALLIVALGFGLVGLKFAQDAAQRAASSTTEGEEAAGEGWGLSLATGLSYVNTINPLAIAGQAYEQNATGQDMMNSQVKAFQAVIKFAEGTNLAADPYRVCYGYRHTIQSLADHPKVTGEWAGESLASLGPAYIGKISTAAGAYQMIRPTWLGAKRALGLRDFGPDSQDAACTYLMRGAGAVALLERGDFEGAVRACATTWASLPGHDEGQPEKSMSSLRSVFISAGGWIA